MYSGALDWFLLLDFLVDTTRHLLTPGPGPLPEHTSVVASWLMEAFGLGINSAAISSSSGDVLLQASGQMLQPSLSSSLSSSLSLSSLPSLSSFSDNDRIFELSAATLYSLAYIQVRYVIISSSHTMKENTFLFISSSITQDALYLMYYYSPLIPNSPTPSVFPCSPLLMYE